MNDNQKKKGTDDNIPINLDVQSSGSSDNAKDSVNPSITNPKEENFNNEENINNSDSSEKNDTDIALPVEEQVEEKDDFELIDNQDEEEEEEDNIDENNVEDDGSALSKIEEIVEDLKTLLDSENPQRKDIEALKKQFYRSLRNEIETQKQKFILEGGDEIDFESDEPAIYTNGKEILQKLKEKRAKIRAKEEEEKTQNLVHKKVIIKKIETLSMSQGEEDFNKTYQKFKNLQDEWKTIGAVPQKEVNNVWRSYQQNVEKFYDLVRINNAFREYDFQKNLEMKTELCEAAERLDEESDVVSAFHQLQNLHKQWREIGPVSRENREPIWERFKAASTVINKKHQAHFDALRENENENLERKTAICEQLEAIDIDSLNSHKAWNNKLKEVQKLQDEWRTIGFVPKKWNNKIYKRYRTACDRFYKARKEFFRERRKKSEENLKKKIALCEQAEALKDSTDWDETTPKMVEIQKEWKKIGHVPYKYADKVWKRFLAACDYYFEQKRLNTSSKYREQVGNLNAKKQIIENINNIDVELPKEEAIKQLEKLAKDWNSIGFVPIKEKDSLEKKLKEALKAQYKRLEVDSHERIAIQKAGDPNKVQRERDRLIKRYESLKNDLQNYENNFGFLSISSQSGNSLLDTMKNKMEDIKNEIDEIIDKIESIDKQ